MNLDEMTEYELEKLARHGTPEEKRAVAIHPNASLRTLLELARDGFHEEVDQNPLLLLHVEGGSIDVIPLLVKIADDTKRSERLGELASSSWLEVRIAVAWNKNTPQLSLSMLAKDQHADVRYGVAQNINTSPGDLFILADDKIESIRRTLANNVNTPLSILRLLTKHEIKYVSEDAKATLRKLQKVPQ